MCVCVCVCLCVYVCMSHIYIALESNIYNDLREAEK